MSLPNESVVLNPEQIGELNQKLSAMRHDVNNCLSLIIAGVEIIRRQPDAADRVWKGLSHKPHQIAEVVVQFSRDFENALGITKP